MDKLNLKDYTFQKFHTLKRLNKFSHNKFIPTFEREFEKFVKKCVFTAFFENILTKNSFSLLSVRCFKL